MTIVLYSALEPDLGQLSTLVREYLDFVCAQADIRVCNDPDALLADCGDAALMLMHAEPNQLEAVRAVRALRPDCPIVLWADSSASAAQSFSTHATAFLIRPFGRKELFSTLSRCASALVPALVSFNAAPGKRAERIRAVDIRYLESFGHSCVLHRSSGSTPVSLSLSTLQKRLGSTFARCHKSYLVNLFFIQDLLPTQVAMRDGSLVPLGSRWADSLTAALAEYREKYGPFLAIGGV